ncbi:MAG: OmpA family protein [Rickettsiales bacterium]|nr:OmpA family protein [Rickettsiales bacterium]
MSRALILFFGIIVAVILAYFCVQTHIQTIPTDIQTRTEAALSSQKLEAIGTTIDGRDITLTGIVETQKAQLHAEEIARSVEGIRSVKNQIMVAPPTLPEPEAIVEDEIADAIAAPEITVEEINKQCEEDLAYVMKEKTILFASGSSTVDATSLALLEEIATTARNCPQSRIIVNGHTDNIGSEAINKRVSQERANAVADYLRNTAQLPQTIEAVGHGPSTPIASNDTPQGRSQNRRIEFNVLAIE